MILLIDKPKGWTSFDVVAKVRGILHEKKVGHAGTLDPNATGLLIVATGADTKKIGELTKNTTKTYEAEIVLGKISSTDDVDGELTQFAQQIVEPQEQEVKQILKNFEGEQMQMPPKYSAIRVNGKKAYELARQGGDVKLEPRKVTIYSIKLQDYKYPVLKITCEVSAGTYIRSIARDLGEKLKTGAYLNELRRTQIGQYSAQKAISLQELQQMQTKEQLPH
ncbi:MAG TPA: tRNA pseudouridine(55) synthase TruB [Patescibacteria group bacterium]|nr:tRNA pseudouridine(55) synthase TruB [Patescibacteria group bacterium]